MRYYLHMLGRDAILLRFFCAFIQIHVSESHELKQPSTQSWCRSAVVALQSPSHFTITNPVSLTISTSRLLNK